MGEFPVTERLGEERLATLVGVSRTPIREALTRLHHEGLVDRHIEGGYRPSIPDLGEVHELYEMRIALEREAMLRPQRLGVRHDQAIIERLIEEWSALALDPPAPSPEFVLVDEEFHLGLVSAAGNRVIVETLAGVNERIRVVRMHDFLTVERVAATIAQHLAIVKSLACGEVNRAAAALLAHLGESMAVVEERAALALARMISGERNERRPEWKGRP
ncbi:MAG: GntR family transcriptional regulator [Actinobacteria bacterium]|nr:GntR family transcriptional regulator [Actinomycetota bacterium]